MLIKEYRIPLPMSVEEYRIAQLYMIQVRGFFHLFMLDIDIDIYVSVLQS